MASDICQALSSINASAPSLLKIKGILCRGEQYQPGHETSFLKFGGIL